MDKKLRKLFDYQKFEQNPRLSGMIAEAEKNIESVLTDDELAEVSAAGSGQTPKKKNGKKKQ